MDLHEGRGVLLRHARKRAAGGAVGLVADDEVELRQAHLLGLVDDVDRLVRREHDHEAVRVPPAARRVVLHQAVGMRGGGVLEAGERHGDGVLLARRLGVGAHHQGRQLRARLGEPFAHRLPDEGNRGSAEQDEPATLQVVLGEAQRHEGLSRAAGHDRLAPVVLGERGLDPLDRLPLVRTRIVGLPLDALDAVDERRPVEARRLHLRRVDQHRARVLYLLLEMLARPLRRRHDHVLAYRGIPERTGEEGVADPLRKRLLAVVALALDRPPFVVGPVQGDEIDPRVLGVVDRAVLPLECLLYRADLVELLGPVGVVPEEPHACGLVFSALLPFGDG